MMSFLATCLKFSSCIEEKLLDRLKILEQRQEKLEQNQKYYKRLISEKQNEIDKQKVVIQNIKQEISTCQRQRKETTEVSDDGDLFKRDEPYSNSSTEGNEVGFSTVLTRVAHLKPGNIIQFDSVTYNAGNGYNSGVFICPKSGLYLFLWNIMAERTDIAHVALYVNGRATRWSYAVSTLEMSNAANSYLMHLNEGDRVYLAVYTGDVTISPIQSSFTGLMVS